MHQNDAHPSFPACVCTPCAEAARHSHSLNLHREHPLRRDDGRLGTQPVAGRSFIFPRVFKRSIVRAPPPGPRRRRPCVADSAASEGELLVEVVVGEDQGRLYLSKRIIPLRGLTSHGNRTCHRGGESCRNRRLKSWTMCSKGWGGGGQRSGAWQGGGG